MSSSGRLARYYDMTHSRDHYLREARLLDEAFRRHGVITVLDVSCGTGSHVIELAHLGYACVGQDRSPAMLGIAEEKARRAGVEIEFLEGDMRGHRATRTFDAVLALNSMASLTNNWDFEATIAAARRAVRGGGLFCFNVLDAEVVDGNLGNDGCQPRFFLGRVAREADTKVVQFHNLECRKETWNLTTIHLIDDEGKTSLEISEDRMQLRTMDHVGAVLSSHGMEVESIDRRNAMGVPDLDVHIVAVARHRERGAL